MLWSPEPQKPEPFALAQLAEPEHILVLVPEPDSDLEQHKMVYKPKNKNERPTFWETMWLVTLKQ